MLLDVGTPGRNLVVNLCFYLAVIMVLIALVPWGSLGARAFSRLLRWLPAPAAAVGVAYEMAMPNNYDIRVDLLILLPAYGLIAGTSVFRWIRCRASSTPCPDDGA